MNNYQIIEKALKYISENSRSQPSLKEVANYVGLSEFHFQKVFTDWAGVSPKKFLSFLNLNYAKDILKKNGSLLDATYTTGLSSTSRLHDLFVTIEAMTPAEYKNGGNNLTIEYSFDNSIFGNLLIASTNKGICDLIFEANSDSLKVLKTKWPNAKLIESRPQTHNTIIDFINNKLVAKSKINLHLKGTNFQLKVWEALLKIPEGKFATYSDIAKLLNSKAYRAVGSAVGDNHIAYIIPCHRVIKATGEIGNYRWGKERKLAMIGLELSKSD